MASDPDWESSSSCSDLEQEPEQMLTTFIQVIQLDCFQRMEWIGPLLQGRESCAIVDRVREQLFAVDHNIIEDLPSDASTQVKRRRLKDLKALSRKMSRWEKHLEGLPAYPPPTLAHFQRLREWKHTELEARYAELAALCENLTPEQRGEVFALTDVFPVDLGSLYVSVDELDLEQVKEHIGVLNALS